MTMNLLSPLTNHPVRPRQHIWWNRQADLFGGLQVDDEFELDRLLHGKIGAKARRSVSNPMTFLFMACTFTAMDMPQR